MHRVSGAWCCCTTGGEEFDRRKWDKLTSEVCFHKLAFRVREDIKKDKENYYNYILTEYGRI